MSSFEDKPRRALATSLYRDDRVSLGKAAKVSGLSVSEFIDHLGSLGIDIVRFDETTPREADDVSAWLARQAARLTPTLGYSPAPSRRSSSTVLW